MKILLPEKKHSHDELNWEWIESRNDDKFLGQRTARSTRFYHLPEGTLVECTCGEIVVAYRDRYKDYVDLTNRWIKASWLERRRYKKSQQ